MFCKISPKLNHNKVVISRAIIIQFDKYKLIPKIIYIVYIHLYVTKELIKKTTMSSSTSLLREFLRTASTYPDYNIGQYIKRRALQEFRVNKDLKGNAQQKALEYGRDQLNLAKRQSAIRGMFTERENILASQRIVTRTSGNVIKKNDT
jgi:hypothetical protein